MKKRYSKSIPFILLILCFLSVSCEQSSQDESPEEASNSKNLQCDEDNGGLILPDGFCAAVIADNLGIVRHIAVREDGNLYASLRNRSLNIGGILVLSDTDQNHLIDDVTRIGDAPGMGIRIYNGYLYFASDKDVVRYKLSPDQPMPLLPAEIIVSGFPVQTQHSGKPFSINEEGDLYINVGAISNACQKEDRTVGLKGQDPCPELAQHAGIWRFDANKTGQQFSHGERYASGIRNAYAIDWQPDLKKLYVAQHGRDHLHELWPKFYLEEDEELLPAEELIEVNEGVEYGWPYCYYDQNQHKRLLAPEYGGDGKRVGRCVDYPEPVTAFPGHYGPNDLIFYQGEQFPEKYRGGAFIAFHGSYLMNASEQVGYQVVFVPLENGQLSPDWQVFADHFVGDTTIESPQDADYRPTGLAIGPDGSLYISDSVQGRIWRVIYYAENTNKQF